MAEVYFINLEKRRVIFESFIRSRAQGNDGSLQQPIKYRFLRCLTSPLQRKQITLSISISIRQTREIKSIDNLRCSRELRNLSHSRLVDSSCALESERRRSSGALRSFCPFISGIISMDQEFLLIFDNCEEWGSRFDRSCLRQSILSEIWNLLFSSPFSFVFGSL